MNEIIDPRSVDRPNSYIGKSVPRPNARKLVEGRGQYVDDMVLPRMVHVAFVRSPHAHAKIVAIDRQRRADAAGRAARVRRARPRRALRAVGRHAGAPEGHEVGAAAPPAARARDLARRGSRGRGRGKSRGGRGCRCARAGGLLEPLPAVVDMETALLPATPVIHPELGDNLCFQRVNEAGKVDDAFAAAHKVVEATFHSGRHTGLTLEPRSILADYNRGSGKLTVHHATQAPHMMQAMLRAALRLPEGDVRVICGDVGGSYGIKVHVYPDEMAVAVIAKIMGRPVKFIADRLESFCQRHPRPRPSHQGAHGRGR